MKFLVPPGLYCPVFCQGGATQGCDFARRCVSPRVTCFLRASGKASPAISTPDKKRPGRYFFPPQKFLGSPCALTSSYEAAVCPPTLFFLKGPPLRLLLKICLFPSLIMGMALIPGMTLGATGQFLGERPLFEPTPAARSTRANTSRVEPSFLTFDWATANDRKGLLTFVNQDDVGIAERVEPFGADTLDDSVPYASFDSAVPFYRTGGWLAGVEVTYLRATTAQNNFMFTSPGQSFQFEGAPRVWIERVTDSGWGLRGAYWTYDAERQFAEAMMPEVLFVDTFGAGLQMYAIDLEVTRRVYLQRSDIWMSLGVRNARLHHTSTNHITTLFGDPNTSDVFAIVNQSDRNFNGTGLTTALGWRRPVFDSEFALVANTRTSVLWGGNAFGLRSADIQGVAAGNQIIITSANDVSLVDKNNAAMWIGELQVGGEWGRDLTGSVLGTRAFARVMFEGQWWATPALAPAAIEAEMYNLLGVTGAIGFMR